MKSYSFDGMCLGLVEHFYPHIPDELAAELAQRLQDCVEDFGRELIAADTDAPAPKNPA